MKIEQIYTGCLSQGAYYIYSEGEVAIIDPMREVGSYIQKAKADNAEIVYVFETHFHADFVSGHVSLSEKTGATIVFGPTAETHFDIYNAHDMEEFKVGALTIVAIHTPGHTTESTCYLLRDSTGNDVAIFSGDTLFLGDVGRPDLAQNTEGFTTEILAGKLYDSLRNKILPLSDDLLVYPGHGAGSACGKNMMKATVDTLGNQKKNNYALQPDMSKEEFIEQVTAELNTPPSYFPLNVALNKKGYEDVDTILKKGNVALSVDEFEAMAKASNALVLDVRHQFDFAKSHIPSSIFIGIDGSFAPWVGSLIVDVQQPILLVVDEDAIVETITRLSRVGFDNTLGYLKGGVDAWIQSGKEIDSLTEIKAEDFASKASENSLQMFDVRKQSECDLGMVAHAIHTPLTDFNKYMKQFSEEKTSFIYCGGGYRSVIAMSILKSRGIHNLVNVLGGFGAIKKTNISIDRVKNQSTCSQ
ncbi:MAG: MBL fold metallo-hydrolase [Flavicella sp.]